MENTNIIKARIVKTPTICFISDCHAGSGYDYEYHRSIIDKLYFDGELPTPSFKKNWYVIKQFPKTIQRKLPSQRINARYEIIDKDLISAKLPGIINCNNRVYFNDDNEFIYDKLYTYKYDMSPELLEDVEIEWKIILDAPDFKEPPKINFTGIRNDSFSKDIYIIDNNAVLHQTLDEMIFPEVLLHNYPCKFTSQQVYNITRKYILEHIDNSVAKITSNYDFCFAVKKLVPKRVPEVITYSNIFARSKKERLKLHTSIKEFSEYTIFEMTTEERKYEGYTPIAGISANNETELNDKMNTWLTELMAEINKPICECPYCNGTGLLYEEDIDKTSNQIGGNK